MTPPLEPARRAAWLPVLLGSLVAAAAAFLLADLGTTALYIVAGVVGLGIVAIAAPQHLRAPVTAAWRQAREALMVRRTRPSPTTVRTTGGGERPGPRPAAGLVAVAVAAAGLAWVAASQGTRGLAVVVAAIVMVALLAAVRDRSVFFTFLTVCSLVVMLHKSFGPQDLQLSSGAIAVYVTTFDVMLLLLYALWFREGTLVRDLRAALREPIMVVPLAGVLLMLPSLLVAPSTLLGVAELVRMGWMYLLFCYVAVRVRTRRHIGAVLAGLVVFMAVELVVVVLQWRTGGVLGLSWLGVPTELGDRVTDAGVLGRPFGTIIHPVFMAAALGMVALVALAFALALSPSLVGYTAFLVGLAGVACMWLAHTRASLVAATVAALTVLGVAIARRWVRWRTLGWAALAALGLVAAFYRQVEEKFIDNFRSGHFLLEVDSRLELNDIAARVIDDHLLLGVGLNNFEVILPRYEASPVIFFGHPVHNLYLLVLAETGIVGFLGLVVVGVALYDVALQLARSRDRLYGPLGVGIAGAMGFIMVEELLGFSLRQDVPLALYWLMAGLAVAALRLSGRPWPGPGLPARRTTPSAVAAPVPSPPRRAAVTVGRLRRPAAPRSPLILLLVASVVAALAAFHPPTAQAAPAHGLVFSAVDRTTGSHGIYTAAADGSGIRRVTPADGREYSWPRWAFGNTKIVYTARTGLPGSPEEIAIMDPDGSDVRVLERYDFWVAQPVIDRTGRYCFFTARAPWFPEVAVFRLDLTTGESENVTATGVPVGGFDSDPSLTPEGGLVFIWTRGPDGSSVAEMDADGADRRVLTEGAFDTDPSVSPDGRLVATASYRGGGTPQAPNGTDPFAVRTGAWNVVLLPRGGGSETVLTDGQDCTTRSVLDPCAVGEMSGFLPRFTPDGRSVTFTGAIDSLHAVIAAIDVDGSNPRVLVSRPELAIDWHDWPQAAGATTSTAHLGTDTRTSRLLLVTARPDGTRYLVVGSPDLMHRVELTLPQGLQPLEARWGPDGQTIAFTAEVEPGPARVAATPGRRVHATLDDLDATALALRSERLADTGADLARRQVFVRTPEGTVRQVTTAWSEDPRDGLADGDARANTNPVLTPDGALLVTNTSTLTGESFVLRVDLSTGAVVNLTNATAGAVPTDDAEPALSPDGSTLAFSWSEGGLRGVYAMDARTGAQVRPLTTTPDPAWAPAWEPGGRSVVHVVDDGDGSRVVRSRVDGDAAAAATTVLSGALRPAWRPVPAPEGDRTLFLAAAGGVIGLYAVDGDAAPRLLQPDPLRNVFDLDVG